MTRIVEVVQADGMVEFIQGQRVGLRLRTRLAGRFAQADVGVRLRTVLRLHMPQRVGLAILTSVAGSIRQAAPIGLRLRTRLAGRFAQTSVGMRITQIRVAVNRRVGASTVTNIGAQNWANPGNAVGRRNGTVATAQGQALATTNAQLRVEYVDATGKDDLVISSVQVGFYVAQSGTTLGNGGLFLEFRTNPFGVWIVLEEITGNVGALTTPRAFDLTSLFGLNTWDQVRALEFRVRFQTAVGTSLVTASCDAVEMVVIAEKIDTL